ncbi:hypothetical protein [Antarctobacter sp.]|uniref:hypothetical protein n=1 Tax=Antarctobacter sp. TaxID=1872577 RepID=UPI003A8E8E24
MLVGLDRVDWTRLNHGHGPATDVPAALRALALGGASQAARALAMLNATLCPQGRLYTGTVAAIPFLAELAQRPGPNVPGLLHLLRAIAEPACTRMLTQEQTTGDRYAEAVKADAAQSKAERVRNAALGLSPRIEAECHAGVAKALPDLVPLLTSDTPAQVAALLMLLAEAPAAWTDSAPRIAAAIDRTGVPAVQRAGLAALGRLARSVEAGPADPLLRCWLAPGPMLSLRAEAGLSMTVQETARGAVLLEALHRAGEIYQSDRTDRDVFPRPGWTVDRVAACLSRWRGDAAHRTRTATAIMAALPQARTAGATSTGLIRALLATLAAGAPIEGLFRGRRRSLLTDLDRQALQAIAAFADWTDGETRNDAFASLMRRCGLPDTAPGLAQYATRPGALARLLRR